MAETDPTGKGDADKQGESTPAEEQDAKPALPSDLPQLPGITLDYEIARGGMGVVYSGRQDFLDRRVAVKFLSMDLGGATFAQRFQREAKILAGIRHANIVGCHMADTTPEGQSYLVMEFIDGPSLRNWIEKNGPVSPAASLRLIRASASALAHAYQSDIIHRDVKPENILLESMTSTAIDINFPYTPKLVDLGLARMTHTEVGEGLTSPGSVMGTPATMSPEQFDDPDSVDFRSDIYGLGCCLYEMLIGHPAFRSKKLTDIVVAKRDPSPPNPCIERPDIPASVGAFTQRLLASNRENRPASYKQLDQEIRQVIDALESVGGSTGTVTDLDMGQTIASVPAQPSVPPQPTATGQFQAGEQTNQFAYGTQPGMAGATGFQPGQTAAGNFAQGPAPNSSKKGLVIGIAALAAVAIAAAIMFKGEVRGENTPPVASVEGPAKINMGEQFEVVVSATDADGDQLSYNWDWPEELLTAMGKYDGPTVKFRTIDGLPNLAIPAITCAISDDQQGSTPAVVRWPLTISDREGDISLLSYADLGAASSKWQHQGKWRAHMDPRDPAVAGRRDNNSGVQAIARHTLGADYYWEWRGTVEPTEMGELSPQTLISIQYGAYGYGLRIVRSEEETKWFMEVVEREPNTDNWVSLAEPKVVRWVQSETTDLEHRAWFSIRRELDRIKVEIAQWVPAPLIEGEEVAAPTLDKRKFEWFPISPAQLNKFNETGAFTLKVEEGRSKFRISKH